MSFSSWFWERQSGFLFETDKRIDRNLEKIVSTNKKQFHKKDFTVFKS